MLFECEGVKAHYWNPPIWSKIPITRNVKTILTIKVKSTITCRVPLRRLHFHLAERLQSAFSEGAIRFSNDTRRSLIGQRSKTYIKVHTATRWTMRHSLTLLWFADLINVTEEVTIHRPNVSTLLSSAFIRGDLNAATRGLFIWSLISGLFSDEV